MQKTIHLKVIGFLLSCGLLVAGSAAANDYVVIVNAVNPVSSMSRKQVAKMVLGKVSKWEHGDTVVAYDLPGDNATRAKFSEEVCKKSPDRVKAYWLRQVFAGRGTPPDEKDDHAAIVAAVAKKKGGIGYVAAGTELAGVKAVTLTE